MSDIDARELEGAATLWTSAANLDRGALLANAAGLTVAMTCISTIVAANNEIDTIVRNQSITTILCFGSGVFLGSILTFILPFMEILSSRSSKVLKLAQSGYDATLQLSDELHELTQAFGRNSDQISSLADSIERFFQSEDGDSIIKRDKILAEIKKLKSEELNQYSRITLRSDDLEQGLTYLSAVANIGRRLISTVKMFSILRNFLLLFSMLTFLVGLYYGISTTILLLSP